MPEQTANIQRIIDDLNAATTELRAALMGIEQTQAILQGMKELDETQQVAELEASWQHLLDLSLPVVNAGAHVVSAMGKIGQQLGTGSTVPNQMQWLTGTDVRAQDVHHEQQQRAAALLRWLEPYLQHVSAKTRTTVTLAISKSANGQEPSILIERLTPQTFMLDIQRGDHTGVVANIRGLGPRGLRELREAMSVERGIPEAEGAV